uniref:DUF834 domain-containing protein n=1 Tax=Oryza punctata TaxID=4537 RepID=A0A0E0L2P5_ORYPU
MRGADDREEEGVGRWRAGAEMLTTTAGLGGDRAAVFDGEVAAAVARGKGDQCRAGQRRCWQWHLHSIPVMGVGDDAGDGGGGARDEATLGHFAQAREDGGNDDRLGSGETRNSTLMGKGGWEKVVAASLESGMVNLLEML